MPVLSHVLDCSLTPALFSIAEVADLLKISLICRECRKPGKPRQLVLCGGCGPARKPVHRECLRDDPEHQPPVAGQAWPSGDCNEVDFRDYAHLTWLLNSQLLEENKKSLHLRDLWSTWFGVPHDQVDSPPKLFIWPRMSDLINSARRTPVRQYPSLVSFVGDTGSGKSTLIRAMIRMLAPGSHEHHSVPVPGTEQDQFTSTSSDVHLFADPATISTEYPILMAGTPLPYPL